VSGMGKQNKEHQPPPLGFGWTTAIYGAARTARGRRPDVMLTGGSPATCGDNSQEKKGDQSMCTTREEDAWRTLHASCSARVSTLLPTRVPQPGSD
jgi:hypothetical protein